MYMQSEGVGGRVRSVPLRLLRIIIALTEQQKLSW